MKNILLFALIMNKLFLTDLSIVFILLVKVSKYSSETSASTHIVNMIYIQYAVITALQSCAITCHFFLSTLDKSIQNRGQKFPTGHCLC